ncbi:MAG: co-chaperone YbbN [Alphaproteobacteria bacterium]|nr:co-chaperone YbbN [Alphaproteobacteria bacterium]
MDPMTNPPLLADGADAPTIVEGSPQSFLQDVVEPSKKIPVFVYFWMPNPACEPFTPVIERLAREAGARLRLVKMNVQQHPEVAQQLQLQTVPAVMVFQNGAPVNGFMGPIPEDSLRQFFGRMLGGPVTDQTAETLEAANQALKAGDIGQAQALYSDVLGQEPENADALAGIIESFLASGDTAGAKSYLEDVPEKLRNHSAIAGIRARIELAEQVAPSEETEALAAKLSENPNDHAARYELALAEFASGNREAAIESLLEIIRRDRKWNDKAAHTQLLKFFEALGPEDPLTVAGRRQLSSLLFS